MSPHDFLVCLVDTDSLTVSKRNTEEFSQEEIDTLTKEINSLTEGGIVWDLEFYVPKIIVLKSKNYIIWDGKKIKTKGSSIRDQKKEPALREFLEEIIKAIIDEKKETEIRGIYYKYVREAMDVKDIKRWCSKKTITEAVMESPRKQEKNVRDAIKGTDYRIADKVYVFFKEDESLCLLEKYNGDYNRKRLLEKLHNTALVFDSILDTKYLFHNFKLKKYWAQLGHVVDGTI